MKYQKEIGLNRSNYSEVTMGQQDKQLRARTDGDYDVSKMEKTNTINLSHQ